MYDYHKTYEDVVDTSIDPKLMKKKKKEEKEMH